MEANNELEKFLSNKLSVDELNIETPALSPLARKTVMARKKSKGEIEDFFSMMAAFLNFKIKLYHAVIATVIICGSILYFTREDKTNKAEANSGDYISNLATAKSSTVLSSISTFALTKEQTYGNRPN